MVAAWWSNSSRSSSLMSWRLPISFRYFASASSRRALWSARVASGDGGAAAARAAPIGFQVRPPSGEYESS